MLSKSIPIVAIKKIIKSFPTTRIEEECHAWGCCSPHYKELIDPKALISHIEQYEKRKKKHEKKI